MADKDRLRRQNARLKETIGELERQLTEKVVQASRERDQAFKDGYEVGQQDGRLDIVDTEGAFKEWKAVTLRTAIELLKSHRR